MIWGSEQLKCVKAVQKFTFIFKNAYFSLISKRHRMCYFKLGTINEPRKSALKHWLTKNWTPLKKTPVVVTCGCMVKTKICVTFYAFYERTIRWINQLHENVRDKQFQPLINSKPINNLVNTTWTMLSIFPNAVNRS